MSQANGVATGSPTPNVIKPVLKGARVMFAEKHFDAIREKLLTKAAEVLGATFTTDAKEATIILVNPSSEYYRADIYSDQSDRGKKPQSKASEVSYLPYHYLACCKYANRKLPISALPYPKPIFTHPDRSLGNPPLRVWVSVNVHRGGEQSPQAAQAVVIKQIEKAGGLIVDKRSGADLLIVDRSTQFYMTCLQEHKRAGRHWQRFAERDWVEDCVRRNRLVWPAMEVDEKAAEDEVDSMAEEDPVEPGKGPGRPPGKTDYTPEDDDFMIRWIAAHPEAGSSSSRKTYTIMTDSHKRYPIAARHSPQSWHEHFKKNAAIYTKRVERLRKAGVNHTLKTAEERKKAKELREQKAKQKEAVSQPPVQEPASSVQQDGEIPGTGQKMKATSTAQKEGARLTEMASKAVEPVVIDAVNAALVEDGHASKEPSDPLATSAPVMTATQPKKGVRPALVDLDSEDEVQDTIKVQNNSRPESAGDKRSTASAADQSASSKANNPASTSKAATEAARDGSHEEAGQPKAKPNAPAPKPEVTEEVQMKISSKSTVSSSETVVPTPDSAQPAHVDIAPAALEGVEQIVSRPPTVPVDSAASGDVRSPRKVRIEVDETMDGQPRHSSPHPERDVFQPRHSVPALHSALRNSSTPERGINGGARFSLPSSTVTPLKRSLVQEAILSTEKKRMRSIERASRGTPRKSLGYVKTAAGEEDSEVDTVLASTTIPPAQLHNPPDLVLPPRPPPAQQAIPGSEGWADQVERGKSIVQKQQDEYKRQISKLCEMFGLQPGELVNAVNQLPKKKKRVGEMYWQDVEMGLREKFGK